MYSHVVGQLNEGERCGTQDSPEMIGALRVITMAALLLAFLLVSAAIASAQTYKVLYSFAGGSDGANPTSPVTLDDSTGSLYGTTGGGGFGCSSGCGTVFELTPAGIESVLYSFTGPPLDGV